MDQTTDKPECWLVKFPDSVELQRRFVSYRSGFVIGLAIGVNEVYGDEASYYRISDIELVEKLLNLDQRIAL